MIFTIYFLDNKDRLTEDGERTIEEYYEDQNFEDP